MACKYIYKGITYSSKEEFISQVINPQFLGKSNSTLPFIKSNNTIDDDFFIKDELTVTEELQNIRTSNWDGSINKELEELKNELNQLPVGSRFNTSAYTNPTPTNLQDVLNKITLSESNKVLLEKIKPLIKNIKIEYVDKFILANSGAIYSDKYNTIRINKSEKNIPLEELLMHELLHAATFRKISYFETNAKGLSEKELLALNELENIRKVLKETSDKYWDNKPRYARSVNPLEGYRTDSIHEIISYAFTNKEFRNAITDIPYKGSKSILDKLVELIANIFGVKQDTILNALLANTEILLENNEIKSTQPKTRRILEVQSDLFQKGRDKDNLIDEYSEEYQNIDGNTIEEIIEKRKNIKSNQFLQLLNKDNNWVTFFVKSIIQDSAKKGYEKVLFLSGNTAAKVEGQETLEGFKKVKENRIKQIEKGYDETIQKLKDFYLEDVRYIKKDGKFFKQNAPYIKSIEIQENEFNNVINTKLKETKENNEIEINQLKKELETAETDFGSLRAIYKFYETTITNILKKQGYNPIRIKDEYGNEWNEIQLIPELANKQINFSKSELIEQPSDRELNKALNNFIEKAGIEVNSVKYLKNKAGKIDPTLSAEAKTVKVAEGFQRVINIVSGRDTFDARAEEVAHIFTAMLGYEHPLYKAMEKRIVNYAEYKEVIAAYPELTDSKDIKFEAIGKVIKNNMKDLLEKKAEYTLQNWWDSVLRVLGKLVSGIFSDPYKKAAYTILEANVTTYNEAEIQANSKSRLEELDDVYKAKTNQYYYGKSKAKINKNLVSLNPATVKAINQREIDKVAISSDIDLNTSTVQELKEVLRDTVSEYAYVDAGGMTFLAEQVQKGNWKLSCSL